MKNNTLLLVVLAGIGIYLITRRKNDTAATPPPPVQTRDIPASEKARVSGYFPSYLTGARPEYPYQVRWGSGNNFMDTMKKAQLVI